jgi:hypothetical protein
MNEDKPLLTNGSNVEPDLTCITLKLLEDTLSLGHQENISDQYIFALHSAHNEIKRISGLLHSELPKKQADATSNIHWTVEPDDVEWEMDWSQRDEHGVRRHPDRPEKEKKFESEPALALLLINKVIFINSHWFEDEWPEEARKTTSLNINCNDLFAWGCADSEECSTKDIKQIYQMWRKDPSEGPSVWCMIRRKEMPQNPVEKYIRKAGIWDLDTLQVEHGLRANYYDGMSRVCADHKREVYQAWAESHGIEVLPFDAGWWKGWELFVKANPGWHTPEWEAEDERRRQEWKQSNGWV